MNDDEMTAYHEAGHCVVAILLGGIPVHASILPSESGDRYGDVEIHWPAKSRMESQVLAVMAGPVAEMIYRGEPLHPGLVEEWSNDWKQADHLMSTKYPKPNDRIRQLEQIVAKLYRRMKQDDCWQAVSAIADLLLAFESLEQDQIEEEIRIWIDRL